MEKEERIERYSEEGWAMGRNVMGREEQGG